MNRNLWLIAALLVVGTLVACTSDKARREGELAKLASDITGQYESADKRGGALVILPVHAGMIGDRVFYLERRGGDGEQSQYMLSLELVDGKEIMQHAFVFKDAPRWRNALQAPELLKSLVPQDLRLTSRCSVTLTAAGDELDYACGGVSERLQRVVE
ncbi:MAG TPA: CpcT/CpeT family chromophore lyase [Steroidobacteraceae bacterium]|nr:CpcT/CpeT family chromophore lyase [Steroidobacteraceae bacterium]